MRRLTVKQRNTDFNNALQAVCAQYRKCTFDGWAIYNYVFSASDVSTRDYFHPSLQGQTGLAAIAWAASGLP